MTRRVTVRRSRTTNRRTWEAGVHHYTLKKAAIVLTLSSLIVMALWALGLLRVGGAVVY
jgi:hypothetical protein